MKTAVATATLLTLTFLAATSAAADHSPPVSEVEHLGVCGLLEGVLRKARTADGLLEQAAVEFKEASDLAHKEREGSIWDDFHGFTFDVFNDLEAGASLAKTQAARLTHQTGGHCATSQSISDQERHDICAATDEAMMHGWTTALRLEEDVDNYETAIGMGWAPDRDSPDENDQWTHLAIITDDAQNSMLYAASLLREGTESMMFEMLDYCAELAHDED